VNLILFEAEHSPGMRVYTTELAVHLLINEYEYDDCGMAIGGLGSNFVW